MGVLDFEDSEATIEAVMFPKQWSKYKPILNIDPSLLYKGAGKAGQGTFHSCR